MILTPGQRIDGESGAAYMVVGPAWSTPRHDFHRARKRFLNYRHQDRSLFEADDEESLGVLIRVPREGMEGRLRFELDRVLNSSGYPWHPEPLDVVEGEALVLADPLGTRLSGSEPADPARLAGFLVELLEMLEDLASRDLQRGAMDPGDFTLADSGRWVDLGTDLISEGADPASDLAHWAAFVRTIAPVPGGPGFATIEGWAARCLDPDPSWRPASFDDLRRGRRRGWFGR